MLISNAPLHNATGEVTGLVGISLDISCANSRTRQHKARLRFNKVGKRLIVRVKPSRMAFAGNTVLRRLRSHPEDMFSFGEDASMGRGIPMMISMSTR